MSTDTPTDSPIPENRLIKFSMDNAASNIFWINKAGGIIYANRTACKTLEYSIEELQQLSVHNLDTNFPQERWDSHWQGLRQHKTKTIESIYKKKSGKCFPVEIIVNHLELDGTEFHCVSVRDITKQKRVEELLRESEERFRLTLDATSNGMWDLNLQTGDVYYGANWASSLGYLEEDLLKGRISWQGLLHPEDKEQTLKAVQDHIDGKTPFYTSEFRLLNSQNKWQWILARGKVVHYSKDGKPQRFVGTQTNISERKKAEQQLKKQSEKISFFAYTVAHDLKNPTVAIRGIATRLHEKCEHLSKKQIQNYSKKIVQSSEQVEELVEKLNTFVTTKETPISIEDISFNEILSIVKKEFSDKLQRNEIAWQQCNNPVCIKADRVSLLRVLRNFIDNSLKYGGFNLSKISVEYEEHQEHHVIAVCDNGVGLSKDDTIDVFSPFERKSTSKGTSGTGLGLAIVKEVALQHKGSVWTEPDKDGGVKFCFSISKFL